MRMPYRCMLCRTRNTFVRKIETYVRPKKCKSCGHTRFYIDRWRLHRNDYCRCEGYHYTHRKGSTFCIHHPQQERNVRVERHGEHPLDVFIDQAFDAPPVFITDPNPPF